MSADLRLVGGGKTITLSGLAFKPNTDDMRDAPSRVLMEALWSAGAAVRAFDPAAMHEARRLCGDRPEWVLCDTPDEALPGADALAIVTEWNVFRSPDFALIRRRYPSLPFSTDAICMIRSDWPRKDSIISASGAGRPAP